MANNVQALGGTLGLLAGLFQASEALQARKSQERLALLQLLGRDPSREVTVASPAEQHATSPFQRFLGAGQFQAAGGSPVVPLGGTPLVARQFPSLADQGGLRAVLAPFLQGTAATPVAGAAAGPSAPAQPARAADGGITSAAILNDPTIRAIAAQQIRPDEKQRQIAARVQEMRQEARKQGQVAQQQADRARGLDLQAGGLELRQEEAELKRGERAKDRAQRQEERAQDRAERQATRELIAQNRGLQQEQLRLRLDETKRKNAGVLLPTEQRKTALDLRSNIRQEPAFKDFAGARQAFNIILGGAKRAKEAGKARAAGAEKNEAANLADLALISGFARLLDPGSVVRPSEFETVRQSRAVLARIETIRARLERGEQLLPRERQEFVRTARAIMKEYIGITEKEIGPIYRNLAESAQIPFGDVFVNPRDVLQGGEDKSTTASESPGLSALRQQFKEAGGTDAEFDAGMRGEQP